MKKIFFLAALVSVIFLQFSCTKPPPPPQPPPPNKPPVANAGPDQTITFPNNSVILSGTGTDVDGTITSWFEWRKLQGPQANIESFYMAETVVKDLVPGVYLFEFTVTDNKGAKGHDTVKITVNRLTASAGPAITLVNDNMVSKWFAVNLSNTDSVRVSNGFYSGLFNYDTALNYNRSDYVELAYAIDAWGSAIERLPLTFTDSYHVDYIYPYTGPNDFYFAFALEYEIRNTDFLLRFRNTEAIPSVDTSANYGFYESFDYYAMEISGIYLYRFIIVPRATYNSLNINWNHYHTVVAALGISP